VSIGLWDYLRVGAVVSVVEVAVASVVLWVEIAVFGFTLF
jgi:hypothetical protein